VTSRFIRLRTARGDIAWNESRDDCVWSCAFCSLIYVICSGVSFSPLDSYSPYLTSRNKISKGNVVFLLQLSLQTITKTLIILFVLYSFLSVSVFFVTHLSGS
jgi:hypothetical protein